MTFEELDPIEQQAIADTLRPIAENLGKAAALANVVKTSTKGNAWAFVAAAIAKLDDGAPLPNTNRMSQAMTVITGAHLKAIVALQSAFTDLMTPELEIVAIDVAGPPACLGK